MDGLVKLGPRSSCGRRFAFETSLNYLIFDRDRKFGLEVVAAVKAAGIQNLRAVFEARIVFGPSPSKTVSFWLAEVLANHSFHDLKFQLRHG